MKPRHRRIALLVSVPGLAACLISFLRFYGTMWRNELPWNQRPFFEEHYAAVSHAYSQAFVVGFFSCFFLLTVAVAIATWHEQRHARGE